MFNNKLQGKKSTQGGATLLMMGAGLATMAAIEYAKKDKLQDENEKKPCSAYNNDKTACVLRNSDKIYEKDKCFFTNSVINGKNISECINYTERENRINIICGSNRNCRENNEKNYLKKE